MTMEVRRFPIRYEEEGDKLFMVSVEFVYWDEMDEKTLLAVNEMICVAKGADKMEFRSYMCALQRYARAFYEGNLDEYLKDLLEGAYDKQEA